MKKNKKWTVLALICLLMLMLMVLPVKAETTGSIAIQLHSDAAEVEMTLYKVAAYADEEYTMTEEFQGCGITTKQLSEAKNVSQITETLEKYVAAQKLKGIQKTKKANEILLYEGLSPGLYFAVQTAGQDKALAESTLILLPSTESGEKNYHPEVTVKCVSQVGAVILNKTDPDGNVLEGACFRLQQKNGDSWKELNVSLTTNKNGQLQVSGLPFGKYQFVETKAPDGFVKSDKPAAFEISKAGEVTENGGKYETLSGTVEEVQVVNQPEKETPPGSGNPGSHDSGSSTKASVKTGDNTPIALFVFLLAAGACAGLAVSVKIKKGKK